MKLTSRLPSDKHGIVEQIAGILGDVGINCLYQSTFSSANILVSKSDIARARRALEEHGRERGARAERGREEGELA